MFVTSACAGLMQASASLVLRGHTESTMELLLRLGGGCPIVVLTLGRILLFAVSGDLLQHTADI